MHSAMTVTGATEDITLHAQFELFAVIEIREADTDFV
jgi:hypothetical protein